MEILCAPRFQALTRDNYETWKVHAQSMLIKNKHWKYVNGTHKRPEVIENDQTSKLAAEIWDEADSMARADLLLTIHASELRQVKNLNTSNEIWKKLESVYQSTGPAKKAALFQRLVLHKMQEHDDVKNEINEFFATIDRLGEMDIDVNEQLASYLLLISLPESFRIFRCAVQSRDDLPAPELLKVKIFEEIDSRKAESKEEVPNAMVVYKEKQKYKFPKEEKRINVNQNNSDNFKGNMRIRCYKCNKFGHKIADCRMKNTPFPSVRRDQVNFLTTVVQDKNHVAMKIDEINDNHIWCLDSGCSSHMCGRREKFIKLEDCDHKTLKLATNHSTNILGKGQVKTIILNNEKAKVMNLDNALYVPNLRANLLSISKITEKGFKVLFQKDKAFVMNNNGDVQMTAERYNDLYYFRECGEYIGQAVESKDSALVMWHRRLGHLNERSLKEFAKNKRAIGLKIDQSEIMPPCEICIRAKMTRTPFPQKSKRSTTPLEIIHMDLCGPMRVKSHGGSRYLAVFIDDSTRWCEVRFLRQKSDVLAAFKEYKAMVENFSNRKIKCIQTDNGLEYCNADFDNYLKKYGIKRRVTVPYSPQQNGIAERKNRTLIETARCLMLEAGLPPSFWAEAVNTANYVRNRCPSRSLNGESAYKMWTGKNPVLSYFRCFGSKVFVLDQKPGKGKFDARSKEAILVGYSDTAKGYRVWMKSDGKIVVTRDVKFREHFSKNYSHKKFIDDGMTIESEEYQEILIDSSLKRQDDGTNEIHSKPDNEPCGTHDDNVQEDEEAVSLSRTVLKRGSGRPRYLRTGNRGRPCKIYSSVQVKQGETSGENTDTEYESGSIAEVSLNDALSGTEMEAWKDAIRCEYKALLKNGTWNLTNKPVNRNIVGCRVILTNKMGTNGIIKKKARLVAKGYSQEYGVDFNEVFSPVARPSSIRIMMGLAVQHDMHIHHLDVSTAFLNGDLEEEIFMELPDMYEDVLKEIVLEAKDQRNNQLSNICSRELKKLRTGNQVCSLKKAIYGLKQSGRQWNKKFDEALQSIGLTQSTIEPCCYYKKKEDCLMLVLIYVDDLLIASQDLNWMSQIKRDLMSKFEMKDLGEVRRCLGVDFVQSKSQIVLHQKRYIEDVLNKFGMGESKSVSTPMDYNKNLTKPGEDTDMAVEKYPYRSLIGALMYISVWTRPDIAFSVNYLSQFNDNYGMEHWVAAKRILRYLKGTIDKGLIFQKNNDGLQGFVDADWGSCSIDRRSFTGYVFKLHGTAISWEARKQRTVALSSTEAEYMGLSEAAKEAIYLSRLLRSIEYEVQSPVQLFGDNQGAIKLAKNPIYHGRTKHIDIRHHFIRDVLKAGDVYIDYVPTERMIADVLTKALCKSKLESCIISFGVKSFLTNTVSHNSESLLRGSVEDNP